MTLLGKLQSNLLYFLHRIYVEGKNFECVKDTNSFVLTLFIMIPSISHHFSFEHFLDIFFDLLVHVFSDIIDSIFIDCGF